MNNEDPAADIRRIHEELKRELAEIAQRKVNYRKQCSIFAPSKERCALCENHPGEHRFPVTSQRDELKAALEGLMTYYVGDRDSKHVIGPAGLVADAARSALANIERADCGHENGSVVHLDEGYRWQCADCGYTRELDLRAELKERIIAARKAKL